MLLPSPAFLHSPKFMLMADLPPEVIVEILCWLPVKTLLFLRCISRSWRSIIDGRTFANLHLKKSLDSRINLNIIVRRRSYLLSVDFGSIDRTVKLNHPLMCYSHQIKVLGSCNGLLCICNVADDIAFWNPSTRKYRLLPFFPTERRRDLGVCLSGDRVYGFGFDAVHGDYKLVRISLYLALRPVGFNSEVMVYSLRRKVWNAIKNMPYYIHTSEMGILVDGNLHWVGKLGLREEADLIVAFDLEAENFKEVPKPMGANGKFKIDIGALDGCLCFIEYYGELGVDVWVMKEYGLPKSWTKLLRILNSVTFRRLKYVMPLTYSKNGCKILLELDHDKLVWFDLESKQVEYVRICGMPSNFNAGVFVGSFVSVDFFCGVDGQNLVECATKSSNKRDDFLSEGFKLVL